MASRTAVRTTGSPSRPTARQAPPSNCRFGPARLRGPCRRSSENVAALTKPIRLTSFLRPIRPGQFVGNEFVRSMRIWNPQQCFGKAHQRDAFLAAEVVGVQEGVEARGLV